MYRKLLLVNNFRKSSENSSDEGDPEQPHESSRSKKCNKNDEEEKSQFIFLAPIKSTLWMERWFWSSNAKDILRRGETIRLKGESTISIQKKWYSLFGRASPNEAMFWVSMDSQTSSSAKSGDGKACWVNATNTWTQVNHCMKTGQYGPLKLNYLIKNQTVSGEFVQNYRGTCNISYNMFYTIKVKNQINSDNPQVTNALKLASRNFRGHMFDKYYYTRSIHSITKQNSESYNLKFKQWLAGLIDVKGSFLFTKKGYASLELVMNLRDERVLQVIKNVYGGSIKLRSNANALRYRLHHKEGLLRLIKDVNGEIRNPNRLVQLSKLCRKYDIFLTLQPEEIRYNNGWLSGVFEGAGELSIKSANTPPQLVVSVTLKDYNLLVLYQNTFRGNIELDRNGRFTWSIDSKALVLRFLEYIKTYTLRADRHKRFFLVPKFFNLQDLNAHRAPSASQVNKAWSIFKNKFHRSFHTSSFNLRDRQTAFD